MIRQLKPAILFLTIFVFMTGLLYPALITGLAQIFFPIQANGSQIVKNGEVVGSVLIGQQFDQSQYFWGRPSATSGTPYNASASGGSNYSALNPALVAEVKNRLAELKSADPQNILPIPVDLVTSSASGLDPDISLEAAAYQANRVAQARNLPLSKVQELIRQYTQPRLLGFLVEPTVNVLQLNLALDQLK